MAKSNVKHNHAYAASVRICTMNLLLQFADYTTNHPPTYGEDINLIDIGGDYMSHLRAGRMNVHCDKPFIDMRDSAREQTRKLQLARMLKDGKVSVLSEVSARVLSSDVPTAGKIAE